MAKLHLTLAADELDELHRIADRGRKPEIKVKRQVLINLMIDHARALRALQGQFEEVTHA